MSKAADFLMGRWKYLLDTGNGPADVHFLVGEGDEKEATPSEVIEPVEVHDVEVGAFKAMLNFIYVDDFSGLSEGNVMAVLYAAKKYNVARLLLAIINFPIPELSNVFLVFDQARFLGEEVVLLIN
uniref:BTB domain-containing protein n=1 Tax=Globodera pallida TaxID=36090 RepID=A0A183CFG5_GLOPA